ncbi:MAG: hypothetical protein V1870_05690 [Candidatus Aenigmatarchaeota archaeon]
MLDWIMKKKGVEPEDIKVMDKKTIELYFDKAIHMPSLNKLIEVEEILKNAEKPLKRAEIKRKLKHKILHQSLNVLLAYLLDKEMIMDTKEGLVWIYYPELVKELKKITIPLKD